VTAKREGSSDSGSPVTRARWSSPAPRASLRWSMQRRRGGDEEGEETPSRVAEGGIAVTTPQEATVSWGELPRCPPASRGVVCAWDQARTSAPRSPLGRRKPTVGL